MAKVVAVRVALRMVVPVPKMFRSLPLTVAARWLLLATLLMMAALIVASEAL